MSLGESVLLLLMVPRMNESARKGLAKTLETVPPCVVSKLVRAAFYPACWSVEPPLKILSTANQWLWPCVATQRDLVVPTTNIIKWQIAHGSVPRGSRPSTSKRKVLTASNKIIALGTPTTLLVA